jgi:nucleotide-binding universal stress UspA family protein
MDTTTAGTTTSDPSHTKLRASDFQSSEVPHYFLTSGRKWLVCIDGSAESKLALFHALDLMNTAEDSLIVVHAAKKARSLSKRLPHWRSSSASPASPAAVTPAPTAAPAATLEPPTLVATTSGSPPPLPIEQEPEPDSVKRGKGYLAHAGNLISQWGEEVKWSPRFIEAKDPREAICDLASEEKVDYIVMGSRGQNPIRQIFMGSVSSYVSSHAICPVIIIHETPEQRREKKAASLEEKKMNKKTLTEKKSLKKKWLSRKDQKKAEGQPGALVEEVKPSIIQESGQRGSISEETSQVTPQPARERAIPIL